MQYVRSISGSVSKTWNSINPATLSGAIDVIVVEAADGELACSPFHVRFGKFSLLRPSDKKVEFRVRGQMQDYSMKLGDGGEAFFVFETSDAVPPALQTSPLLSPLSSMDAQTHARMDAPRTDDAASLSSPRMADALLEPDFLELEQPSRPASRTESRLDAAPLKRASSDHAPEPDDRTRRARSLTPQPPTPQPTPQMPALRPRSASPPSTRREALERAQILSKQLSASKIATRVTESGDLMLDMTGYKSSDDQALRAEVVARKILAEELQGNYDIGALIGADEQGNLWIYSSEEAKEAAQDRSIPLEDRSIPLEDRSIIPLDAASDPGHASDDGRPSHRSGSHRRSDSDAGPSPTEPVTNYAKTLRLTSDQLKALQLTPGPNPVSFTVNRATCHAHLYLWRHDQPVVISDIDGTITKSDALGQVLNLLGRDWTHVGVAKLYSEIVANGYDIIYLTSRSVGQADTTRAYLQGVVQDGYRLPRGPTIMSPDRTIAALRRELYIRKPEVFKMACLRDIKSLFGSGRSPFYAGFGNRLTDALSYRSVAIPSNRIFTINSNAEVSLDLLALNKLKLSYVNMREVVDHYFPPVGLLVRGGGEDFTDFTYWREDLVDLSLSGESDGEGEGEVSGDDGGDGDDRANEDGVDGRPYDMDGRAYDIDGIDINGIDIDGDGDGMDDSFLSDQSQPYDAHDDGGLTTAA